jgi:hypothetical protein
MYDNYYSDYRVRSARRNDWFESFDDNTLTATVRIFDPSDAVLAFRIDEATADEADNGVESCIVPVRCINSVCPTCDGRGHHVNPSIDCDGISADDFRRDPEFADEYRSGAYDVRCYGCNGNRVVPVISDYNEKCILDAIDNAQEEQREFERMQDAERRMGC